MSFGFVVEFDGFHHTTFRFRHFAICTHDARLASWSQRERISSEDGGYVRAMLRLRNSWVVEGPITMLAGKGALMYFAAVVMPAV